MSNNLLWVLIIIFVLIGIAGVFERNAGMVLYGFGAAILNLGIAIGL